MGERETVNKKTNKHNFEKRWSVRGQKTGDWHSGRAAVVSRPLSWAKWREGTSRVKKWQSFPIERSSERKCPPHAVAGVPLIAGTWGVREARTWKVDCPGYVGTSWKDEWRKEEEESHTSSFIRIYVLWQNVRLFSSRSRSKVILKLLMKSAVTKDAPKYYRNVIGTCAHLTWPLEGSIAYQM